MELKFPEQLTAAIVTEVARKKLGIERMFTKVVSQEDAALVLESFVEWADENSLLDGDKIDLSRFTK